MIETSKDVFWIIFTICIAFFTVFVCAALYYIVSILSNANRMVTSVRQKIELVDKILTLLKERIEKSSSHLSVITDSVIKLVSFLVEKQAKKKKK